MCFLFNLQFEKLVVYIQDTNILLSNSPTLSIFKSFEE